MEKYKNMLKNKTVKTVYFGGGTPPLIGSKYLNQILEKIKSDFNISNKMEISLEANPNSVTKEMLCELTDGGFNRISFGVQSSNPHELKLLGRTHTARDAAQAVFWAREAGFENVSIDLMIGTPDQTVDNLLRSIDFATALDVTHISAYILKIEEGTLLSKARYALDIPDDDEQADYYLATVQALSDAGYAQYEISNFAKKGMECAHNLIYWNGEEYLGLGPSAHSFVGDERFCYESNLNKFINNSKNNDRVVSVNDSGGDLEEYIMLRLRLNEGVVYEKLEDRFYFPANVKNRLQKKAKELVKHLLCTSDDQGIRLTTKGFLLSNYCTSYLLGI